MVKRNTEGQNIKNCENAEYIATEIQELAIQFDRLLIRAISEGVISISKAAELKKMKVAEFYDRVLLLNFNDRP